MARKFKIGDTVVSNYLAPSAWQNIEGVVVDYCLPYSGEYGRWRWGEQRNKAYFLDGGYWFYARELDAPPKVEPMTNIGNPIADWAQPFGVKFEVSLSAEKAIRLPKYAIDDIDKAIRDTWRVYPPCGCDNCDSPFWEWGSDKTNPFGSSSFVKRVKKWLSGQGCKPDNDFMGKIGDIAGKAMTTTSPYICDLTDNLDWAPGDFGDYGSCFWDIRRDARTLLKRKGAIAIRCYDRDGRGLARAWVVAVGADMFVVFNGYGNSTETMARLLAEASGNKCKRIALRNNGRSNGVLYFNGGFGYIVGPDGVIGDYSRYDLGWSEAGLRVR